MIIYSLVMEATTQSKVPLQSGEASTSHVGDDDDDEASQEGGRNQPER